MTHSKELWRLPKVEEKTGIARSTIHRKVDAGTFPPPRQIGDRAIAWLASDVEKWMDELPFAKSAQNANRVEESAA